MIVDSEGIEDVKMTIVEALIREEGEATAERMLYAYHKIKERFRNVEELLEFVEENLTDKVRLRNSSTDDISSEVEESSEEGRGQEGFNQS